MKVMLNPIVGSTLSCRGINPMTKQTGKELPQKPEGLSNEQIYNAIMSFKNKVTRVLTGPSKTEIPKLNTIA